MPLSAAPAADCSSVNYQQTRQIDFTLDIPPGIGAVRIKSAVIAYPVS